MESQLVGGMWIGATEIRNATIDGDLLHFTVPSVAPGSYEVTLDSQGYVSCAPYIHSAYVSSTFTAFATLHAITIVP